MDMDTGYEAWIWIWDMKHGHKYMIEYNTGMAVCQILNK